MQAQPLLSTDQIKTLVEAHLLQFEYGGGGNMPLSSSSISSVYAIACDIPVQFDHVQLPRKSIVSLQKKWLAFMVNSALYLLDCIHWLRITGDNDPFITFDVKDLLCIYNHNSLRRSSREIQYSDTREPEVTTAPPLESLVPYRPFRVTHFLEHLQEWSLNHSHGDYERRLQMWCDYALVNHHYPNTNQEEEERTKLLRKMLKRHDRFESSRSDCMRSYWYASFGLLYHLIRAHIEQKEKAGTLPATFLDTLLYYESVYDLDFPMFREFIDWEIFLFTHSNNGNRGDDAIDLMTDVMNAHHRWYEENSRDYGIPLPLWFKYHLLSDNPRLFWLISTNSGNSMTETKRPGYLVRFEWLADLLSMATPEEQQKQQHSFKVVEGRVFLNEHLFRTLFMPNLYKQILLDTVRLVYMLYTKDPEAPLFHTNYQCGSSKIYSDNPAHYRLSFYSQLPVPGSSRNLLYQYSIVHGSTDSPVISHLAKLEMQREEISEKAKEEREKMIAKLKEEGKEITEDLLPKSRVISRPPFREVAQLLPDIEDVVEYLPPCLKNLAGVKHLNHADRWRVIPYFIDMGYNENDTVRKLAMEPADEHDLKAQYQHQKRKNAGPDGRDPCSLSCRGLINLETKRPYTITCPFELEQRSSINAPKKAEYNDKEVINIRVKCAASIKLEARRREYINHPIDYVQYKIQQQKQQK